MWVVAAVAFAALAAGVSAYGAYKSGQNQQAMYKYQADVANQQALLAQRTATENQQLAERKRQQDVQLTQTQAQGDTKQLQRKFALLEGAQKAARAGSGLGGGSVSEGDIATDTFDTLKSDEEHIRYNADVATWAINEGAGLEAWNLRRDVGMETWGLGNQATQYRKAGAYASEAGKIQMTSSILEGASAVAGIGLKASSVKKTPTTATAGKTGIKV
jgi:hypothetical protein